MGMPRNVLGHLKLRPGYAETSTRKYPVEPELIIVGRTECDLAQCQGSHPHPSGEGGWLRFKLPDVRRYYFQHVPY
jgi:hypothetical protein